MKVIISEEALRDLEQVGVTTEILHQLVDAVAEHPAVGFKIDTFDGLSCMGVPLSWLRDHQSGEALIMTRREAYKLDRISGKDPTVPDVRILF